MVVEGSGSSLMSFWSSLSPSESSCPISALTQRSVESSIQSVHWMIRNRGGFAWLTGLVLLPSQFGRSSADNEKIITTAAAGASYKIEKFTLTHKKDDTIFSGIIYYPPGWNPADKSRCIAYHNPNGATIADFFVDGQLFWTPGELAQLKKCPIVMYDYRGSGISQDNYTSSLSFRPTYATVVEDGVVALEHVLKQFKQAEVWGSSLGGGVAAKALALHLEAHPTDGGRVSLANHDSFSTSSRVILPSWHLGADWAGWAIGGHIDAETAIRSLIDRGIKITILCHRQDPVIPAGARLAEKIEALALNTGVRFIYSPSYGHANLSPDMIDQLRV